jgi:hypothetical protein
MIPDLAWLTGDRLVEVAKRDHSWAFIFSSRGCITTEQAWRLVANGGVAVASEDHGQLFGLSVPIDASTRVLSARRKSKFRTFWCPIKREIFRCSSGATLKSSF